ncbi:MAG: type II toxin-antitoxin system HipA family toxin [Thermoleophilia bacterium]|nr:type II toxin-antitoxin system HipA family toxin [Thermoleophilia bacterium]
MTSEAMEFAEGQPDTGFVWIWLPGATQPVVAGRVDQQGETLVFRYGKSYLANKDSIAIYDPELPLDDREYVPEIGTVHGCLSDAGPDSWGKRAILHRRFGDGNHDTSDLRELTYLMSAGSDRIGALDFQKSSTEYVAREFDTSSLSDLLTAAESVEAGVPLPPDLEDALLRGTSVGGARPKSLVDDGERHLIAKFSSLGETFPTVQAEFVAMRLAKLAGIDVSNVEIVEVMDKKVLLVDRFDRQSDGSRRAMVSALTILGLDEIGARYASYAKLAEIIRHRFSNPDAMLRELFSRITFNILTSNTDDHARNQAAFWDGKYLSLTPAYDVCPQPRSGQETKQAMAIGNDGWRFSQLAGCVARSEIYHLSSAEAHEIVDNQVHVINAHWQDLCEEAMLTPAERSGLWNRQFLNPFAFLDSHT